MPTDFAPMPVEDSASVKFWRRVLSRAADGAAPLMDVYKPYVDGLDTLPPDGRFLLVGNHTQSGAEILLISYFIRKALGRRVRPLADRRFGNARGPQGDLLAAYGAQVGSPENAAALMRADETVLVFPGGGGEIAKFKGEEYGLRWGDRTGFVRVASQHDYPIVTAAQVGGDDVFTSLTARDGAWGRLSQKITERFSGRTDMAMPLMRGVGPTLVPQPQRMYLRFGPPIATARRGRVAQQKWNESVRDRVQTQLVTDLSDLLRLREGDPYRQLNPLAWRSAIMPPDACGPESRTTLGRRS